MSIFFILIFAGLARAYDDIRFLPPWQLDDMKRPAAVAITSGRTYILDGETQALFLYDAQGKLLKSVGRPGSGKSEFSSPEGLCADGEGHVYVADTGNHRIQVLDEEGRFLSSFGSKGSDPGLLRSPAGVATGKDGRVYVADAGNDRIQVFTRDGIFLFSFGAKGKQDGQMKGPARVWVDPSDFIYVLDSGNDRISKFDPQTRYVKSFNVSGADFALDAYGYFYVLDPRVCKVREMKPDGVMEGSFGSKGEANGQFKGPEGIAVAPDGTVAVLDRKLKRLTRALLANKLKTAPVPLNPGTKLLISGPYKNWPLRASALAASADRVYAYLPETREFAAVDSDGRVKLRFGGKEEGRQAVSKGSSGMAAGEQGIFAADSAGDRMLHFDLNGNLVGPFAESAGIFDSKKKEGRVKAPRGVALNEKNVVYVANEGARRVDAFGPDGSFLFSIGPAIGTTELKQPVGVAWSKAGFVYILDRGLKKVFKCEPSGGFVASWGDSQGVAQMSDPAAIAAGDGYVFVLDGGAKRVEVFSKDGSWVTNFFSGGRDERSLGDPASLAVRGREIFVSDPGKGRILGFDLHPFLAPPVGLSTSAVEGTVALRWQASPDVWAGQYRVQRSSVAPAGPFEPAGATPAAQFADKAVHPYMTYYYRVATEARTGDVGPASPVAAVYVPGASNQAPVEISSVTIGGIFSANYKFYEKNPVGSLAVTNNVDVPFENVKVTFQLKDFMDFGTDTVLPRLDPRQRTEIPLKAVLNNRILGVTEDTPIQAEFKLTYFDNGKEQAVSRDLPLRVYSRNAITWDRPERIATFITLNDTPVKDFQRQVMVQAGAGPAAAGGLNSSLKKAILLWDAMGAAGIKYEPSPNSPFESVSQDPAFPVDYTQFPRETLKHRSGQCDDLATLFSSLLEAASVKTALLDYPGHIALMFDTGVNDPALAGLPASQMVLYQDTYWIPFEPTVVGAPFADSHRKAMAAYEEMKKGGKASVIDPRSAWAVFEPATMPPTDWSPEAPKPADVAKRTDADLAYYAKVRYAFLKNMYRDALAGNPKDGDAIVGLGIAELDMGNLDKAGEQFEKALAADPGSAAAMNNLGSIAFLSGRYERAVAWFAKAADTDPQDPGIWLNLAKVSAKLNQSGKVKQYGNKAIGLDPNLEPAVQALLR